MSTFNNMLAIFVCHTLLSCECIWSKRYKICVCQEMNSRGTGDRQFSVPYSVDVVANGNVWVADRGNHRIQEFDKDGKFLFKFGSFGAKPGQFNNPRQVAVDKDMKYLYVVDSKNNRIQKFFTNGTFVKSWGTLGTGNGQFSLPVTIIMDSKGNLIVNERGNSRVQKFDSNGTFLLKFGSAGKGDGQFTDPEHLAIDSDGNVYVTDRKNNNIQVFKTVN